MIIRGATLNMILHQQGSLDGLCGVYSIVNAVSACRATKTNQETKNHFEIIINYLNEKNILKDVMIGGMSSRLLNTLLKVTIDSGIKVAYSQDFKKSKNISLNNFWEYAFKYMAESPDRTIIIGIDREEYGHWTVIVSISPKRITLYDSNGLHHINRSNATISIYNKKRKVTITPTVCFFIEKI